MDILFASHNAGKVEEVRQMLGPRGINVVSAADLGLPVPEETEDSFVGNALLKARAACAATGLTALADDSGLCVAALDGAPGVWTADWAETESGRDFGVAMARTHDAIVARGAAEPWLAAFVCVMALVEAEGRETVFEGRVEGRLVWPLRGALGHGYDPMFQPHGEDRTFAEMTFAEKNALSHRGRALRAVLEARFT